MITLSDSVEIKTTPDKLFDWFKKLDEHFEEWHPNHKKFVKITGGTDEGDIFYFEEVVEGRRYRVKVRVNKIEKGQQGWLIELVSSSRLARILFIAEAKEEGCVFTHIERFGVETPVIGCLLDFLMSKVFYILFRFDLIRKDMEEDGLNLKRILEER